jgi:hypothetical protein
MPVTGALARLLSPARRRFATLAYFGELSRGPGKRAGDWTRAASSDGDALPTAIIAAREAEPTGPTNSRLSPWGSPGGFPYGSIEPRCGTVKYLTVPADVSQHGAVGAAGVVDRLGGGLLA